MSVGGGDGGGAVGGSDTSLLNCGGRFSCLRAIPVNIDVDVRTTLFRMSCKAAERGGAGEEGEVEAVCVCVCAGGGRFITCKRRASHAAVGGGGGGRRMQPHPFQQVHGSDPLSAPPHTPPPRAPRPRPPPPKVRVSAPPAKSKAKAGEKPA